MSFTPVILWSDALVFLLLAAGAASVDVAVTHALFADDALQLLLDVGVSEIWSTDCITHSSNATSMASAIAAALTELLRQ